MQQITDQVRSIALATTAVANGDLSVKVDIEASGEIAALCNTINDMIDRLTVFATEVTRVAREVGTKGMMVTVSDEDLAEMRFRKSRSHGKGGQHRRYLARNHFKRQYYGSELDIPSPSIRSDLCRSDRGRLQFFRHRRSIRRDGLAQDQNQPDGLLAARIITEEYGREGSCRVGEQVEIRILGKYVPRDPNANEWNHRNDRCYSRDRSDSRSTRESNDCVDAGQFALTHHRRYPRYLKE